MPIGETGDPRRCDNLGASVVEPLHRVGQFAERGDQEWRWPVQVAEDVADLRRLSLLDQEKERLKRALRDWQTRHARECRPNRGYW